jgi:beta-glucosidase
MLDGMTENASSLLAAMTLEEKASLCSGSDFWHTQPIERLAVASVMVTDGPHGLRKQPEEADHLGLGESVPATCFPPAVGLASSWNPELVHQVGAALGTEARAEKVAVLLGPGINIKRSPLCGRNFEYFSEDPLLTGVLASAYVQGVQGQGVGTSLKHFAANNQETDRLRISAVVDERTLREIYLSAFERVVRQAQPWTVMCSYNKINGVYASEHRWLLTQVLREEWDFAGLVMSDWGAVNDRVAALTAGLDLEMPSSGGVNDARIVDAVRDGSLPEPILDRAVLRVLALLSQAEPAMTSGESFDVTAHQQLARQAARECAVLLKNDGGLLPLDPDATSTVAVIGEFARTPRYQGAGSSQVNPTQLLTAWDEIRRLAGTNRKIGFAPGYGVDTAADGGLGEAVELARTADQVLLFLGLPPSYESEGWDRDSIDLPPEQLELVSAVAAVNSQVAVVLSNGAAVAVSEWQDQVAAVFEGWLLGQAGGGAIADLLFGFNEPSGRLAETIPLRLVDTPSFGNFPGELGEVRYGEGLLVGYRYYDTKQLPVAYPFGHGLGYTTFDYSGLSVTSDGATVTVQVNVSNTGSRAGSEVVQVYLSDPHSTVFHPEYELKAFEKVPIPPGETRTVTLTLSRPELSYYNVRQGRWVLESRDVELRVGGSSRDLRLTARVRIDGDDGPEQLRPDSSLAEWLQHPSGGPLVRAAMSAGASGLLTGDPDVLKMLGNFPLARLAVMPNSGLDPATLAELLAKVS